MLGKDYLKPAVRCRAAVVQTDFLLPVPRTIIMSVQEKKRLVSKLDFITAPGWLEGGDRRAIGHRLTGHRTLSGHHQYGRHGFRTGKQMDEGHIHQSGLYVRRHSEQL